MGRSENGPDDGFGEPDGSRTGPKPGRPDRAYGLPGGGLAILVLLVVGLVWVAHSRPNHSAVKSNRGTFQQHSSPAAVLAFAPGGRLLATGHHDGCLKILDLSRGDAGHPLEIEADPGKIVLAIAFSPDGKLLASGGEGPSLKLWNVASGTLRASLDGRGSPIRRLAFSPDGKTIASCSLDGAVTLRDIETGREASRLAGRLGDIRGLACAPDGATLAVGALQGDVRIWEVAGGRERDVLRFPDRLITSLAFAPDGRRLAIALGATKPAQRNEVVLWTVASGHEAIRVLGQARNARVAFSPSGKVLAASCDDIVKLWDVETGGELASLEGHQGYITSLSFSPDGRLLATAGMDRLAGLFPINPEEPKTGPR
jgi:WD40 repeat protein